MKNILRFIGKQHYIRFGIRVRIIDYLSKNIDDFEFDVPFYGKKYVGNTISFIDRFVFFFGAYCGKELEFIADCTKDVSNTAVIDIGANVGHHTLFASSFAKKVYAFEPYPKVYEKIYEKIKINKLTNVEVYEFGLGLEELTIEYYEPLGNNLGQGSFIYSNGSKSIDLPVKNGDKFIEQNGIKNISIIKIDVEGFENEVLLGLSKTINKLRPIVFFEWDSEKSNEKSDYKKLFSKDYRFFEFVENRPFLFFFNRRHYGLKKDPNVIEKCNLVAIPTESTFRFKNRMI